jgi:hypothetical protein
MTAHGKIVGISRTSIWRAWKQVRQELRNATLRDVADFIEYDIDPNVWINRLLQQIANGTYEPHTPWRYTLAKSSGFSRRMTMPAIPDVVLYRAINAHLQTKLRWREHDHVYFERADLAKATETAKAEADERPIKASGLEWLSIFAREWMDYESHSRRRKRAWLHYSQYRKLLIFKRVFPFIVTTDITNFFDTILHDKLAECFHSIKVPPRMIGLLFFLLERLSIREAFSDSPRVGLPVDEFDCSRQLAHLFLYSHDDRTVSLVGEGAYVRWMDDQNIGVLTRADGLKALARIGDSLARLHLTANAGKSRVLSLAEARRHFHLDLNDKLDSVEDLVRTKVGTSIVRKRVRALWSAARKFENNGEWDKVLKRFYRYAALGKARLLRHRALADLLRYPRLADRIADYIRTTGTSAEFLKFANQVWSHSEQIYPDVNSVVFERLLRLEPNASERKVVLETAFRALDGTWSVPGQHLCAAVAPLVLLRYGTRRIARRMRTLAKRAVDAAPHAALRASAIVYSSYGLAEYEEIRELASQMFRNPLAETVRMVNRIRAFKSVPDSYKRRVRVDFDAVSARHFLDTRVLLVTRLLRLNKSATVTSWVKVKVREMTKKELSSFDRALLTRLLA